MVQAQDGVSVESDTLGALLYPLEGDTFALDMVIKPERYHEFGIALHVDKELETGYFLRMNLKSISCMGYVAKRRTGKISVADKGRCSLSDRNCKKTAKSGRISSSHHKRKRYLRSVY